MRHLTILIARPVDLDLPQYAVISYQVARHNERLLDGKKFLVRITPGNYLLQSFLSSTFLLQELIIVCFASWVDALPATFEVFARWQ